MALPIISMDNAPAMGKNRHKLKSVLRQRVSMALLVWIGTLYCWVLRLTCRIHIVSGQQHLDAALAAGVVVPCSWHQQLMISGVFMRSLIPQGLQTGFLISPSREGEFITRIVENHGIKVMRGSSSRTGSEAVRATLKAVRAGISPTFLADGPRGPAGEFKPGALIIAQRTGAPVMAYGCAASRYWQLNSWDKTRIPKPFSRITIAIGELWHLPRSGNDTPALAKQAAAHINALTNTARAAQQRKR